MMLSAELLCTKLDQNSNRRRVMAKSEQGTVVVCHSDEGESVWQPVPANGYAEDSVSGRNAPKIAGLSFGTQVVAPSCYLREHQHDANEELLFFDQGASSAVINGKEHPIRPGTTVFAGLDAVLVCEATKYLPNRPADAHPLL
jgi:hypothetical protein